MAGISIIQNSNGGDHSLLSYTPKKPYGTMEGLRLPEVLCGDWRGAPHGGL
jgi:hypothetical protein